MSMYWSGNCILGLLLYGDEIEPFMDRYIAANPSEFEEYDDPKEVMTDMLCCNETFTSSGREKEFFACRYGKDTFEGLTFSPASKDSMEGLLCSHFVDELPIVFIEADKPLWTRLILKKGFYESFDELAEEFKEKVGGYLPDDFPYEERIGDLSYACYA